MIERLFMKTAQITTTPQTVTEWLNFLTTCANQADEMARHFFEKSVKIKEKEDKTLVTEADIAIEREIRAYAETLDSHLEVLGEEFGACAQDAPRKLIIDPIDGTVNFIRGIPIFGSLLAIEEKGEIIAALVSNPITKQRWTATKGGGATYNGNAIHVSNIADLARSQAFYGSLFGNEAKGLPIEKAINLLSQTKRQRGIGDFLMHLWVAMGHGEFAFDVNLNPWDLAPLGLIVTEAGGQVSTLSGEKFSIYQPTILSSNGLLHDDVVRVLNS
eukprot:COSAG01_NODE_1_length_100484_cov_170.446142_34_plen_273_part_00